jgi:hypothetical protein
MKTGIFLCLFALAAEVAKAQEQIATRHTTGKIVLRSRRIRSPDQLDQP